MTKFRKYNNNKYWWWNMNNIVVNYQHRGEENDLYLLNIFNEERIDRLGGISKVYQGDCR